MSSVGENYNKLRKKRKKQENENNNTESNNTENVVSLGHGLYYNSNDIAPVVEDPTVISSKYIPPITSLPVGNSGSVAVAPTTSGKKSYGDDIKNSVGGASVFTTTPEVKKDDKWINTAVFDDGFQILDVPKLILGTTADLSNNAVGGVLEIGEAVVDTGAWLTGGIADIFGADEFAKDTKKFIAKDLYDGSEVARYLPQNWLTEGGLKLMGVEHPDDVSLMGEKLDSLAQSGGQLGTLVALQAVGVPAWLTTTTQGVTAFGGEVQNAFNNDANYLEAGASGIISAGAEILTEKISGGIKIGGKTLDEGMDVALATAISDKTVRTLAKLGVDMAGEGSEEVLSGALSAIGQKMTYASEEELWGKDGLFSSEDAFEAFLGGAILGGAADTIKIGVSHKQGKDFTTGLKTETEQKVVDKLYEDAIAEATKDGKEITRAEEKQIYNDILNALERGEISTDVIEEVLGGEDYKTYKNEIKRQQDLDAELNELRNMKSGEMSDIQTERMSELKAMKPNTDMVNALKFDIDEKIRNGIKDSKLAESYNEAARRTEAYKADLAKYDDSRKAIIQKAIDSKILNNSRKTHELVDLIANISADKGVSFDFTNNEKLKESGFALDGKTVNGFVTKDGVTLNVQSKKYLNSVVGHEVTHVLEGTEFYGELQSAVIEYAKSKGEYDSRRRDLWAMYKNVEGADIDAELTADLVGDYLFTDQDFVNNLTANKNVFQKIFDEIKYLCKIAAPGSKEAKEFEKVKKAFERAYKAESKAVEGTQYSMSDNTGKALTNEQNEYFKDSKMRDENGNLKVMYHGSRDAGFHIFDPSMSDDGISLFFVDRNEVAASYSGTSETYEAQTIHTAEDMNKFIESIGAEGYEVVEKDGKFTLLYEGDRVADSNTAKGIYDEFCWYEGVGEGDANYKVYLNLTNPLVVDAEGRNWHNISREYSQEVADRYNSLTAEEKAALTDLAEWGDINIFRYNIYDAFMNAETGVQKQTLPGLDESPVDDKNAKLIASAYAKLGADKCNMYDLFSIASDNFSEDSIKQFAVKQMNTRDYAQRAKEGGYDGVIFKNIHDNGGYSNGSEGASTVAIAFSSEQVKSVANEKPTRDPDIRYSLSEYTAEEKKAHNKAVVDHFGKTYSWNETGYVLLDGTRLDLSGKNEGAPGGYRTVDHRDITQALGYDYGGGKSGSGSLIQFMSEGNIRIIPECNGINLSVKPTKAQEEALSNYISRNRGEVMLDIDDLNGNTVVSVEYPYGTYYTKVLNDIREWFDNGKKPENAGSYSLTKDGDTPKRYGSWGIRSEDVMLAPTQEIIPKVETPTEEAAPITEEISETSSETEKATPTQEQIYEEIERVGAEREAVQNEAEQLNRDANTGVISWDEYYERLPEIKERGKRLNAEWERLMDSVSVPERVDTDNFAPMTEEQANAMQSEILASLDDADAPAEVEAPYYEDDGIIDPFEQRDMKEVSKDRKVKAYMYENPEVKPFFQEEANIMLGELRDTTKGERFYTETPDGRPDAQYGAESYGYWTGTSRHTSADIEYLLDTIKMSYADIEKGLNAIIEDNGAENIAAAKKIEFILNDRLLNGYQTIDGYDIPANDDYIKLLNEKQITEYNEEAKQRFFENADNFAPIEQNTEAPIAPTTDGKQISMFEGEAPIAPVAEKYEAIRPQKEEAQEAEPRMKRADNPNKAPAGKEERSWVETSTGSEAVDGLVTPDDIPDDVRYYQVKSNKKTLAAANARLEKDGYAKSREYFEGRMSERKLTVEDIALGERLIQEAAKAGDAKAVRDLIIDVSILGTELGQRVQALSMIRRLTPEGQLKALVRTVERGKAKGDKSFDGVEVTEEMTDRILSVYKTSDETIQKLQSEIAKLDGATLTQTDSFFVTGDTYKHRAKLKELGFKWDAERKAWYLADASKTFDQAQLDAAVEDVKQQIADQMKVTLWDKLNAWRYLSMLGNPKTHIRNVVSNVAMFGTRAVKNAIARTVEDIAPIKNKTKTWRRSTDAVKAFAKQTTKEMETAIKGDTKYSEEGSIKSKRQIFKTKPLNAVNNFSQSSLEVEDYWFSKPVFESSFREYLTANGIKTEADIKNNPKIVEKAKDYALEEARKATFRQDSYLADKIKEIENKNKALGVAVGSIMPFKKTPINIAKTGVAYSPLGFARNVYDAVKVAKGEMDASEAVDHLAQTLTGTSLTLIGFALASMGALNGAGEDDKEGKYDYQLGEQSYSFTFGGNTYSLSWLTPVSMPLFVGANAYEKLVEKEDWDANVVVDTLAQTLDPLSEMSFLSSLDDVLSSYDSGVEKIWGAGESMVQNYATQFIPTLSSQVAQTFDDTKRSTKASRDSGFKFGEETLNKIKYKIPGLRNTLEPTTDIWGNDVKQTENFFARGFEAFLSPASKRENITTAVDEEIKDLYSQVGESEVIPSIPYDYIDYKGEKYDMSAEDYTEYKQTYGQTAYDLLEELFDTETYKNATSEERADMVGRVYDYARDAAKYEYLDKIGLEYTNAKEDGEDVFKEDPIKGAIEADLPVDEYTFSQEYPEKYKFFNDNGISYQTYKAADEDVKRAYTWAYENPGKYKMSKVISDDYLTFYKFKSDISDFDAKDENGETVSGLKKERVTEYINGLDLDYGQKIILFKSNYKADDTYNYDIVEYLNSREDLSYKDIETILKELGFTVDSKGNIYWD